MKNEELGKRINYMSTRLSDDERERVEVIGAAIRANDKQIGGDHYKNMGVEPWDVVDTWPIEQRIGYYRGGALKYIMRLGNKDEMEQEAGKGLHYLEKLLEVLKEKSNGR
jgi:hypothetical protein